MLIVFCECINCFFFKENVLITFCSVTKFEFVSFIQVLIHEMNFKSVLLSKTIISLMNPITIV